MFELDPVQVAKEIHERDLLRRKNVVGVGVGKKIANGQVTDQVCVLVFVEKKLPPEKVPRRDFVPRELLVGPPVGKAVLTDVIETGKIRALPKKAVAVDHIGRARPAPGGVSIGHFRITAGTLGVVLHRGTERVILSNNHVLANENAAAVGDPILQPGPVDGGRLPNDAIAALLAFVPLKYETGGLFAGFRQFLCRYFHVFCDTAPGGGENYVDCAIARPLNQAYVSDSILEVSGKISGTKEATIGLALKKSGRTTALTHGQVLAINVTVRVGYGAGQSALFRNQILAGPMSAGGDSGSLVLDDANHAVGLLFAGSPNTTLFNPIGEVLSALGLTI